MLQGVYIQSRYRGGCDVYTMDIPAVRCQKTVRGSTEYPPHSFSGAFILALSIDVLVLHSARAVYSTRRVVVWVYETPDASDWCSSVAAYNIYVSVHVQRINQ